MNCRRRDLALTLTRAQVLKLLDTARAFDLDQGGHFDARSGCVHLWAGPDDKPPCWTALVIKGGLSHPRSLIGTLSWDWITDDPFLAWLYVEASPCGLVDHYRRDLSEFEAAVCLRWLEAKARELVRLTARAPDFIGTRCPFCQWLLPAGELLDVLLEHVEGEHEPVVSLQLGGPTSVRTASGTYPLERVESFGRRGR